MRSVSQLADDLPGRDRLADLDRQAGDRAVPPPQMSTAGESALFVDPDEIPAAADVTRLAHALAALSDRYELMALPGLRRTRTGYSS